MQSCCDLRENFAVSEITLLEILNYLPVQPKGTFHPFLLQLSTISTSSKNSDNNVNKIMFF